MDQAISQLTPEQRQAVMMKAQQEANQQIMQSMIEKMVATCFKTCAGTSVGTLLNFNLFSTKRVKVAQTELFAKSVKAQILPMPFLYIFHQGDKLDSREQSCLANCQDRFLDVREQVGKALEKRQEM